MLRLSLDALTVLDTIDRQGSFAAAAEVLHRVPSAITYIVQKLEQDMDVKLFDRSGHRARLTPAGQELLREGRHLLRAAGELESRVKRVATGWETELSIAMDTIFPSTALLPILADFYAQGSGTRIRITHEVLGGTWDSLLTRRSDLVVGAPGDAPAGGGFSTRTIGSLDFVFCVAPNHPLAELPEPLQPQDILWHRSVAVADTSRSLPPRSSGILSGQEILHVPDMRTKLTIQLSGLACGYLARELAEPYVREGRLIHKQVVDQRLPHPFHLAWRASDSGNALQWWLKRLDQPDLMQKLLHPPVML
ncbi:LysR family transcriptional regulator [Leeia aquatica]|uniref:LysR family transcriptional regulator n=1 Tax=Leeia aquatica TaxID=2725557 RepID=A0A847S4D8_9NEIS|nr:LysR family transcriptional regulator [Leeia aquatica]NLR73615.1 LysR family transcriptional regulator [Leeia aquatica]